MRTAPRFGLLLSLVFPACGGGQPSPAASAANMPGAAGSDPDASAPSATVRDPARPNDGGGVQMTTPSSLDADGDGGRVGSHVHDPGRGPADIRAISVSHRQSTI